MDIENKIGSRIFGQIWNNIGLGLIYERSNNTIKAQNYFEQAQKIMKTFNLGGYIENRHVFVAILRNELKKSKFYPYLNNLFNVKEICS